LSVSIGTGRDLKNLSNKNAQYFGIDITRAMLKRCHKKNKKYGFDLFLFNGNAESLPFKDESFDFVYHNGGINFFNNKTNAINEMIRVAKSGTRIFISDETEKLVKDLYDKSDKSRKYYKTRKDAVTMPIDLIPSGMQNIESDDTLFNNQYYFISFKKP
jgi:ubiquinone/menaquinone biosynthesis C-methylase UbiE